MSRSVSSRSSPSRPPIRRTPSSSSSRSSARAASRRSTPGASSRSSSSSSALGLRHGRSQVPDQVPRACAGGAAHELAGHRHQALHAGPLLGRLLGCQQRRGDTAGRAQALDQPRQEEVRPDRVELGRGAAVQLDEALDPLPRLGWNLGRLGRRGQPDDEVQLAPAGDLDHASQVDLAQADRGLARARTTAAASWGSTRSRSQASTSRTSARLRKRPPCAAPADCSDGAGAILEAGTIQGYAGTLAAHGYALWVEVIDWVRRAADRRAGSRPGWDGDRRPGLRSGRPGRRRRAAGPRLRGPRQRLQPPSDRRRAAAAGARRPARLDRGQPADDAPDADAADRPHGGPARARSRGRCALSRGCCSEHRSAR